MTDSHEGATESPDGEEMDADLSRVPGLGLIWAGIGCVGFVLVAFLVVGLVLPGTWTADRERLIEASPEEVYAHIADLDQWEGWTHWPELKNVEDRVQGGVGVQRSWDDPTYGRGTLTLVDRDSNRSVRYEVRVEGGIQIDGSILLEEVGTGTRVRWTEQGKFGRNPLLRYTALSLDDLQGDEMDKSLDRLTEVVGNR
jgi:uncharacterized protein YndB with AHSA1/START domain